MDPAAMMDRMIERRMENITQGMQEMNIPANEADVLKTQIEALLRMRMAPNTEMQQAMDELQDKDEQAIPDGVNRRSGCWRDRDKVLGHYSPPSSSTRRSSPALIRR